MNQITDSPAWKYEWEGKGEAGSICMLVLSLTLCTSNHSFFILSPEMETWLETQGM